MNRSLQLRTNVDFKYKKVPRGVCLSVVVIHILKYQEKITTVSQCSFKKYKYCIVMY